MNFNGILSEILPKDEVNFFRPRTGFALKSTYTRVLFVKTCPIDHNKPLVPLEIGSEIRISNFYARTAIMRRIFAK